MRDVSTAIPVEGALLEGEEGIRALRRSQVLGQASLECVRSACVDGEHEVGTAYEEDPERALTFGDDPRDVHSVTTTCRQRLPRDLPTRDPATDRDAGVVHDHVLAQGGERGEADQGEHGGAERVLQMTVDEIDDDVDKAAERQKRPERPAQEVPDPLGMEGGREIRGHVLSIAEDPSPEHVRVAAPIDFPRD